MAITAQHLIADVREIASSGGNPNNFSISDELILHWIEQTRSQLISQALGKKDDINDSWINYIPCLEMELADASECCNVSSGCQLLKSTKRLPATIDSWNGSMISKSNPIKSKYQRYNKYTKDTKSWYLKDDYLYIINDVFLELVEVAGLFESPSDLKRFADCGGNSCFTNDSPYPISQTLATQVTNIIIETKVKAFMNAPHDGTNNANGQIPAQQRDEKSAN